jgi:hypothetical protein
MRKPNITSWLKSEITTSELVADIIKAGGFLGKMPSMRKANAIGFELLGQLGKQRTITEKKLGRFYVSSKFDNNKAYFYYNAQSKLLTIEIR